MAFWQNTSRSQLLDMLFPSYRVCDFLIFSFLEFFSVSDIYAGMSTIFVLLLEYMLFFIKRLLPLSLLESYCSSPNLASLVNLLFGYKMLVSGVLVHAPLIYSCII